MEIPHQFSGHVQYPKYLCGLEIGAVINGETHVEQYECDKNQLRKYKYSFPLAPKGGAVGPATGRVVRNIVVRNNKFDSIDPSGAHDGAAVDVSADIDGSPSHYPLLENILFENNVFNETTGPAITAASFKNLIIRSNCFTNREAAPIGRTMRGSIRAELGRGLWVEGNEWTTQSGTAPPSLFYNADTTQAVVCQGNHLKN